MTVVTVALNLLKQEAPTLALKYGPKLLEMGPEGVKYIKDVLKIKGFKDKIKSIDKSINESYIKIGKEVYKSKTINNSTVKDNILRINTSEEEKNNLQSKIEEIELRMKENKNKNKDKKIFDDLQNDLEEMGNEISKKASKTSKKVTKKK